MALDETTFAALEANVERFVRERLVPAERELEETGVVPDAIGAQMRRLGLFGLIVPTDYGGLGLTPLEEIRLTLTFGRTSPGFHTLFGTNAGIGVEGLVAVGSQEQKQRWLPRLASGEAIGAFALTEPEAGSDAAGVRTRAVRSSDGWSITGAKRYISNAPVADLITVLARTGEDREAISAFLVERATRGLSFGPPDRKLGHRASPTCDIHFADCTIPQDALLGAVGEGLALARRVLERGRLRVAALCVGAAERLVDEATRHARTRRQFGKRIGDFQLVRALLADSHAEAYAARCMVLDAAARADAGDVSRDAACAKLFASEMVGRVADRAMQIFGGEAYMFGHVVERFYRDVRLFRIYEGTTQIQQLIIGRALLDG
ncbi:MAG: acyl-CoA dehydrogenase family protein [Salinarimonas sp.]